MICLICWLDFCWNVVCIGDYLLVLILCTLRGGFFIWIGWYLSGWFIGSVCLVVVFFVIWICVVLICVLRFVFWLWLVVCYYVGLWCFGIPGLLDCYYYSYDLFLLGLCLFAFLLICCYFSCWLVIVGLISLLRFVCFLICLLFGYVAWFVYFVGWLLGLFIVNDCLVCEVLSLCFYLVLVA